MSYLVFDCETSSFPNPKVAFTSKAQARCIQLVAILYDDNWKEQARLYEYFKPPWPDFSIAEGAFKAHGISIETLREKGIAGELILEKFFAMLYKADCVIAHNFTFDDNMLWIELANVSNIDKLKEWSAQWKVAEAHCTMELTTEICKLPFATKRNFGRLYKWPKLQEAYKILVGKEHLNAHDSLNDVIATVELFKWLVDNKKVQLDKEELV